MPQKQQNPTAITSAPQRKLIVRFRLEPAIEDIIKFVKAGFEWDGGPLTATAEDSCKARRFAAKWRRMNFGMVDNITVERKIA